MQRRSSRRCLSDALISIDNLSDSSLWGRDAHIAVGDLLGGSALGGRIEELRGRCVLIATADQLTAALALIELDGVARRIVLCPADLPLQHFPFVMRSADVDAIVSDGSALAPEILEFGCHVKCGAEIGPSPTDRRVSHQTEWILLTSGTTGLPKLVLHTLASLTGAITGDCSAAKPPVWSTFYDIRRYGGLQVFLRALLAGGSLALSSQEESMADFLVRAGMRGVTHISGTPSHWRRALMSSSASSISPQHVRLSGEIADQSILDHLRSFYPQAKITHAFASTEAGVAFEVNDGLAGLPAGLIGQKGVDVEMKVEDGSLRIRSPRTAACYLGHESKRLRDSDGFTDTSDMLELRGDRYHFVGRRDGIINVGGFKVHPEEVEAVINRHPRVRMSLVRPRKNAITGALVIADVVLQGESHRENGHTGELPQEILQFCRRMLPGHKVPATINIVPALTVAPTGKIARNHA